MTLLLESEKNAMIQRKDLLALNFYKKLPFHGSDGEKRYRVEKFVQKVTETVKNEETGEEEEKVLEEINCLKATIWPGPFNFDTTPDEKKTTHLEEFSEAGMEAIVAWLNNTPLE